MKPEVIWEGTLDARYRCEVTRVSARSGRLTVRDLELNRDLVSKIVGLSYGAEYGPDVP